MQSYEYLKQRNTKPRMVKHIFKFVNYSSVYMTYKVQMSYIYKNHTIYVNVRNIYKYIKTNTKNI